MSEFWIYLQIGLHHVLDIKAYDHVLFLMALTVPYAFKDWKRIFILVSIFTIGHSIALLLAVFGLFTANSELVELLIPITILITALYNIFTAGKTQKTDTISLVGAITLFFGVIHGLGFSNYFKDILSGDPTDKVFPLLAFALGIEAAQIIVVIAVLILSYIFQKFLRFSKRDFTLVFSAFVVGVLIPMLLSAEF